ncbi:hypothetical protein HUT16_27185 [Kitasatospora sp. NA04385]|uniref:hypothetical protein n=1 Tax=Kitasatospora sp. NA04385 TaxID=2742135 RepID=UPI001591066E|nr:hypothetical protein [Kitasatospora sp. NA04385]QKW22264.1 hypothetical protein HUT16_27185 [Kitasatospora sp. NA04385]
MTTGTPPNDRQHLNEDWLRTRRWDVRYPNGEPVDTLDSLAQVLGITRQEAARRVLTQPFGKAAPQQLRDEAEQQIRNGA